MATERMKFSAATELAQFTGAERVEIDRKYAELQQILSKQSTYAIRDDSRLAFQYCTGQLTGSIDDIAHELMCIQFISTTFGYHAQCEPTLKRLANCLKEEYPTVTWRKLWSNLSSIGCDAIKYACVGVLPDFTIRKMWADYEDDDM